MAWLRDRDVSAAGAVVGAVVFTIGGYLVAAVTNTAHLQAAVWAPWILLAWERDCRGGRGLLVAALLLVVQLLAGAPEVWISTIVVLVAWTVFVAAPDPGRRARLSARLVACISLALVLAAFQLLPTFEYLRASRRVSQLPYGELTYWSMSPVSLLQLVFPHSAALVSEAERGTMGGLLEPTLPLVHSIYLGIGGICLVVAGAISGRERVFWALVCSASSSRSGGIPPSTHIFSLCSQLSSDRCGIRRNSSFCFTSPLWC